MPDVIIVGDGPGGLSAALFLARANKDVVVYGQDTTAMHAAMLHNYLGIEQLSGTAFQQIARNQVRLAGGEIQEARVEGLTRTDEGFTVTLEGGDEVSAPFLLLSEGKSPRLALSLGVSKGQDGGVEVDINGRTSVENLYAVGRSTRPGRSQAIISAGDGAAVAIDILSRLKGEPVCDWDVPE